MSGVQHQSIRLPALGRQFGKDDVKKAQAALADEPVVDRFVRSKGGRCVTPAQPVSDHEDDAAHNLAIIDPLNAVQKGKTGFHPAHLRLAQ